MQVAQSVCDKVHPPRLWVIEVYPAGGSESREESEAPLALQVSIYVPISAIAWTTMHRRLLWVRHARNSWCSRVIVHLHRTKFFYKVFVIGQPSRGLFYVHFPPRNGRGLKIVSQIGECSTPSLSKRGCMPRGEMEDVSGGGAVRAKFLSKWALHTVKERHVWLLQQWQALWIVCFVLFFKIFCAV